MSQAIDSLKLRNTVLAILRMLVSGDYDGIESLSNGVRLSSEEIARAVGDYGRQLILPPSEVFDNLDVIEVVDSAPQRWAVVVDLWSKEEGRSDLSLELTVIDNDKELYGIEIDTLHVL